MPDRRRQFRSQARPALVWALVFFLGGHLLAGRYLFRCWPECCDPDSRLRLDRLAARRAEAPGRPLALVVGSSRVVLGIRPATVTGQAAGGGDEPVLFNLALLGGGPLRERLMLRRVLDKGLRPRWLFAEVWPPFLPQTGTFAEQTGVFRNDLYWSDLPILSRLLDYRWEAASRLLTQELTPLLHYRVSVVQHWLPAWVPRRHLGGFASYDYLVTHLDDCGWMGMEGGEAGRDAAAGAAAEARRVIKPLFDQFRVEPFCDRALRELCQECRANGVRVALLLMPEHSLVRGWYPAAEGRLMPYLRALSAEYGAPVVDARAWSADADLPDCCHLSARGAAAFSERFGREVYRPLVEGRPLPRHVLLPGTDEP